MVPHLDVFNFPGKLGNAELQMIICYHVTIRILITPTQANNDYIIVIAAIDIDRIEAAFSAINAGMIQLHSSNFFIGVCTQLL